MLVNVVQSSIPISNRLSEGEVNGRWVIEARACLYGLHCAGTLVADPAPGEPDDLTFTAKNGKRYWDTITGSRWTPRYR